MSTGQIDGRDAVSHFVEALSRLAGAQPTDRVTIVGCEHVEELIALAQRGFVEALCRTVANGPYAGEAPADLLVAPTIRSEAELLAILSRHGRNLHPGSALIFGIAGRPPAAWQKRLPKLLTQHGFVFVRESNGSPGRRILCCRKLPTWQARAA